MRIYLVRSKDLTDDGGNSLWWNGRTGWAGIESADVFKPEQTIHMQLPMLAEWVAFGDGEMPKTDDEFMRKMLDAFPEATVEQDNDGQLVIYTNYRFDGPTIVSMGD